MTIPNQIDLGGGHRLTKVISGGKFAGFVEIHPMKGSQAGAECSGSLPVKGGPWDKGDGKGWTVETEEPLTLSPSVQCTICDTHGYIRAGRWEDV